MPNVNEFPESAEKRYLRYVRLRELGTRSSVLGRQLAYFGLPSAQMHDVRLWKPYLGHITAVERVPTLALYMYQTAMMIGVRGKTIIIEHELAEAARLLAMDERDVGLSVGHLYPSEQDVIRRARNIPYDIINLDMYGGFLYPTSTGESENAAIIRSLIRHQARHKAPFALALTFNLRDTGKSDYDNFVADALHQLEVVHVDTSELRAFYTSTEKIDGQPPNLIRLRFCVPTYIHKIAFDNFEVRSKGAWYYKTFYHTVLFFEPRKGRGTLGLTWPPIDEFKRLLAADLIRLEATEGSQDIEQVRQSELPAPQIE